LLGPIFCAGWSKSYATAPRGVCFVRFGDASKFNTDEASWGAWTL